MLTHVAVVPQHAHRHMGRNLGQLPQDVGEGPSGTCVRRGPPEYRRSVLDPRASLITCCLLPPGFAPPLTHKPPRFCPLTAAHKCLPHAALSAFLQLSGPRDSLT